MFKRVAVLFEVVGDVLVDLVREAERVMLLAQVGDELELLASVDLAGGVIRIADYDAFVRSLNAAFNSSRSKTNPLSVR
jgi:hypothetical protein